MCTDSHVLWLRWSRVAVVALGCMVAASLAFGQHSASHSVSVDVTKKPIYYKDENGNSAYRLPVGSKDTVVWSIAPQSGITYTAMAIVFPDGTPFADADGRPLPILTWSDKDGKSQKATVVVSSGEYEYCVFAYDQTNKIIYADDPKIIVGNGGLESDVRIMSVLDRIQNRLDSVERSLRNLKNEAKQPK